jgi:integrase
MKRLQNVFWRGKSYAFRITLPRDLQQRLGRREIWRSLATADWQTAKRLGYRLGVASVGLFESLRAGGMLTRAEVDGLIRAYFDKLLADDEAQRISDRANPLAQPDAPERFLVEHIGTDTQIAQAIKASGKQAADFIDDAALESEAEEWRSMLRRRDWASATSLADLFLQQQGIDDLAPDSEQYRLFCLGVIRAHVDFNRIANGRSRGDWSVTPNDPLFKSPAVTLPFTAITAPVLQAATLPSTKTLKDLVPLFIKEKTRGGVKPQWVNDIKTALDWFQQYVGADHMAATIGKADIVEYKDAIADLAANWSRKFPGRTIKQAVALSRKSDDKKLEVAALNGKRLAPIDQFFAWAHKNGFTNENPAAGMRIPIAKSARKAKKRDGFTVEQLNAIFTAPVFTGCKSAHYWKEPGNHRLDCERYWAPIIALYTGGRRAEICQLRVSDIVQKEGIRCISINDQPDEDDESLPQKSVKNESSIRYIPIHPELERIGFLDMVERRRKAGKIMLFDAEPGASGRYDPFGKWFARLLDSVGLKSRRLVFHSFRNTFEQAMVEYIPDYKVRFLLGGRTDEHSSEIYRGDFVPMKRIYEAIKLIEYPTLRLSSGNDDSYSQ